MMRFWRPYLLDRSCREDTVLPRACEIEGRGCKQPRNTHLMYTCNALSAGQNQSPQRRLHTRHSKARYRRRARPAKGQRHGFSERPQVRGSTGATEHSHR